MIPLKNLDNKSFIEILKEARQNIHRFSKEWTDENYHDPGITLLELSSWLTEMQRYYLNRITDRNYSSLFKLLGVKKEENGYANTILHLEGYKENIELPKHMKFYADEQIFETRKPSFYTKGNVRSVLIKTDNIKDVTHLNNQHGICYPLFGEKVSKGNECIILLDEPLVVDKKVNIYFDIKEDYPVELNDSEEMLKSFKFNCYQDLDEKIDIKIENDETFGFRKAGIITFSLKNKHELSVIQDQRGYMIKLQAREDSWITPPEVNSIFMNAIKVYNQNTNIDYEIFNESSFVVQSELINGKWYTQGSNELEHWYDIDDSQVKINFESDIPRIDISKEYSFYRIIYADDRQILNFIVGEGSGVSNHRIRFRSDKVVFNEMILQVAALHEGVYCWTDWQYVDDLLKTKPTSRVFTYDFEEEELVFGNHEFGLVPDRLVDNIRNLRIVKTDYHRGNVKKGHINNTYLTIYPNSMVQTNIRDAKGGSLPQNIAEMHEMTYKGISNVTRAVTLNDYEEIIKKVPGYRLSFCKAISNHLAENQVTLVPIPYNGQPFPVLCKNMKLELLTYLENYRLLTTRIDIVDPIYVEVNLYMSIKVKNRNRFNNEKLIGDFRRKLTPVEGYEINKEYLIGSMPTKAEMMHEILLDTEVLNVESFTLEGLGLGVRKTAEGDLVLPQNAIIYGNEILIEIYD